MCLMGSEITLINSLSNTSTHKNNRIPPAQLEEQQEAKKRAQKRKIKLCVETKRIQVIQMCWQQAHCMRRVLCHRCLVDTKVRCIQVRTIKTKSTCSETTSLKLPVSTCSYVYEGTKWEENKTTSKTTHNDLSAYHSLQAPFPPNHCPTTLTPHQVSVTVDSSRGNMLLQP